MLSHSGTRFRKNEKVISDSSPAQQSLAPEILRPPSSRHRSTRFHRQSRNARPRLAPSVFRTLNGPQWFADQTPPDPHPLPPAPVPCAAPRESIAPASAQASASSSAKRPSASASSFRERTGPA